jgi:hypothetical protein
VLDRPADHTPPHPEPGPLLAPRDQELTGIVPPPVPLPTAFRPVRPQAPLPPPPLSYRGRVHRPVRGAAVAAVLLGVLVLAGVLFLVTRDGGDGGDGGDGEAAAVDAPVTAPPSTSSTTLPTSEPVDAGGATDQADAAEEYFAAISDGDLERSYSMLTPDFQAEQSRASYESFWRGAGDVEVVGSVDVDPDGGTVVVPVTIGGRTEQFPLRLVPDGDGGWLVDGPRAGEG